MYTHTHMASTNPLDSQKPPGDDLILPEMPVYMAVVEVVDLFVFLLCSVHKSSTAEPPGIRVRIRSGDHESLANPETLWFQVKVRCQGLGETVINLQEFMKDHGMCLTQIAKGMEKLYLGSFLFLDFPSVSCTQQQQQRVQMTFSSDDNGSGDGANLVETQQTETKSVGHCFTLKILQHKVHMMSECQKIHSYLYRLKVFHPGLACQFHLKVQDAVSTSQFGGIVSRVGIGCRKMLADLQHYVRACDMPQDMTKIQPKTGANYTLPPSRAGCNEALRLSVVAALAPPQPVEGLTVDNRHCRQLKVLIYGPGRLPLLVDGVNQSGLNLSTLMKLQEHGLRLDGPVHGQDTTQCAPLPADWHYRLKHVGSDEDAPADTGTDEDDTDCQEHGGTTIYLCVLLDRVKGGWKDLALKNMGVLDSLRQNLVHLLCKHRVKVRKAVSSALNKLLVNFTVKQQKQLLLQTAVSNVTQAMLEIVQLSSNSTFQQRCFSLMQVQNSLDFASKVNNKLWLVAKYRYDVEPPEKSSAEKQTLHKCQTMLSHSPKTAATPVDDFIREAQSQLNSLCEGHDFDNTSGLLPMEPLLTGPQQTAPFVSHLPAPPDNLVDSSSNFWSAPMDSCSSVIQAQPQVLPGSCLPKESTKSGEPTAWNCQTASLYGLKGEEMGTVYGTESQELPTQLPLPVCLDERDYEAKESFESLGPANDLIKWHEFEHCPVPIQNFSDSGDIDTVELFRQSQMLRMQQHHLISHTGLIEGMQMTAGDWVRDTLDC